MPPLGWQPFPHCRGGAPFLPSGTPTIHHLEFATTMSCLTEHNIACNLGRLILLCPLSALTQRRTWRVRLRYLRFSMCLFVALGMAGAQAPSHYGKPPIAPSLSINAQSDTPMPSGKKEEAEALAACAQAALQGFRKIAPERDQRFEGKVTEATALCRGGHQALLF